MITIKLPDLSKMWQSYSNAKNEHGQKKTIYTSSLDFWCIFWEESSRPGVFWKLISPRTSPLFQETIDLGKKVLGKSCTVEI